MVGIDGMVDQDLIQLINIFNLKQKTLEVPHPHRRWLEIVVAICLNLKEYCADML